MKTRILAETATCSVAWKSWPREPQRRQRADATLITVQNHFDSKQVSRLPLPLGGNLCRTRFCPDDETRFYF